MILAPVLITVYNRQDKLKNLVDSLSQCGEAKLTELYISSDYSHSNKDQIKIDEIRKYIDSIVGFKKVHKIFHPKNIGQDKASLISLNLIFKSHESFIFMEDDIVVSPNFLAYMNNGLSFYKDDPKVFSICGFSPFLLSKDYKNIYNDIFFSKRWNSWGFGSWKSKFMNFVNNINITDINISKVKKYSIEYYIQILLFKKEKIKLPFDINVGIFCISNDIYNVYPTKTLTYNTGHDGSGLRSGKNNFFNKLEYDFKEPLPHFFLFNSAKIDETAPTLTRHFIVNRIKILLINMRLFSFMKKILKYFK